MNEKRCVIGLHTLTANSSIELCPLPSTGTT